jgi:hypothetical protein
MTRSGDEQPANDAPGERIYIVSAEEVDQFIISLTVVHGYVQLMQRRVLRTSASNREDRIHALERVERAAHDMSSQLWHIIGAKAYVLDNDEPD